MEASASEGLGDKTANDSGDIPIVENPDHGVNPAKGTQGNEPEEVNAELVSEHENIEGSEVKAMPLPTADECRTAHQVLNGADAEKHEAVANLLIYIAEQTEARDARESENSAKAENTSNN